MADRVLLANLVAFALAPWASLRLLLLASLLAGAAARLDAGVSWRSSQARIALLGIGFGVLVVSPYWAVAPGTPLRALGMCANGMVMALWARGAASDISFRPRPGSLTPWLVTGGMVLLCAPGVFGPLEFRGDEDVHLARPLRLARALSAATPAVKGLFTLALALGIMVFIRRSRTRRHQALVLMACGAVLAAAFFLVHPPNPEILLRLARYPILGAGLQTFLALSPLHFLPAADAWIYQEGLYRLASFGSVLAIALWAARLLKGPTLFRAAAALLVGSMPTLVYFAGAGYPEVPAVFIATAGLMALRSWLLKAPPGTGDETGGPPILAIAALVKESLSPLLAMVSLLGGLAAMVARRSRSRRSVASTSLRLALLMMTPIAVYISWRLLAESFFLEGRSMRGFGFDLSALGNPAWMGVFGRACFEQFGPLLLLAAIPLLFGPRRLFNSLLFVAPIAGQLLFLSAEFVKPTSWGAMPAYAGFARYQLTFVPGIVCLAVLGLRRLRTHSPALASVLVIVGLIWNLVARPVSLEGEYRPRWGDYITETSGERYPYDDLYAWIAGRPRPENLTIVGRDYSFRDDFYLRKHGLVLKVDSPISLMPRSPLVLAGGPDRAALLAAHIEALRQVAEGNGPVVLHVSTWLEPQDVPTQVGRLRMDRSFCRGHACLILFERAPG